MISLICTSALESLHITRNLVHVINRFEIRLSYRPVLLAVAADSDPSPSFFLVRVISYIRMGHSRNEEPFPAPRGANGQHHRQMRASYPGLSFDPLDSEVTLLRK